jgi:hypothetical protein
VEFCVCESMQSPEISKKAPRRCVVVCPISTWSPPMARYGSSHCCTIPGQCSSTSVSPGGFDINSMPRPADRRQVHWSVGASGNRRGHCSHRCVDSARRIRGLVGRPDPTGARRRAGHLVRAACYGVAHRGPGSVPIKFPITALPVATGCSLTTVL